MQKYGKGRRGTWIIFLLVVCAAVGGGAWYLKTKHEAGFDYETAVVARGSVVQAVTATGQLNPVVNVQVGSQISGRIQKIYVDYNSVVKSNQVIAEIDPSSYKVALQQAEANLANAKANLVLAQVQARRADSLYTNNLISASDHDTATAQLQQGEAQVESSEAAVENAHVDLSRCTIVAPVDGVVISRNVDVGQTVAASFNTPTLFLIANDLAKMQIDALVSEADIGGVAVGQDVDFTVDAYPYRTFRGKVSQVRYGAITNQNVVNYDCVVEVNNSDLKLLPGMTANISIIVAEHDNVLKVPNAALRFRPPDLALAGADATSPQEPVARAGAAGADAQRRGGNSGPKNGGGPPGGRTRPEKQLTRTVYVLAPQTNAPASISSRPEPVQIKVGISDGSMTEVTGGLGEGAKVVTAMMPTGDSADLSARGNPFVRRRF